MNFGTTRARVARCLLVVIAVAVVGIGRAAGQPPMPPGDMPQRPPVIENAQPDAFYLRDEDGTMVLVPNLSWEEYDRIMRPAQGRLGPLPYYSLITTLIQARVVGDRAELKVRLEIAVDRDSDRALGIPLRLHPAILRESRYEGFGSAVLSFEREANGYVCWLSAPADTRHVVTLDMIAQVKRVGDENRLDLQLPDALAHMEFVLPMDEPDVDVEGEQFLLKPPETLRGGGSKVEVDAFGGDLKLQWREGATAHGPARPSLTVNSKVVYTVQDPTYIEANALLELRTDLGEFSSFHVLLPPGMTLMSRETAGFSVQQLDSPGPGTLMRIDLESSRESTVAIPLRGEISRSGAAAASPLELIGFIVPEAYYQRSDLIVAVDGDWSVRTVESENVRRVDTLAENERQAGAIAEYLWIANRVQPSSLKISIQPQESLITIDPTYVLRFSGQRARLDAVLKFHVRGAAARGFDFWTGDWQLREVKPRDVMAVAPAESEEDPTILPIRFDPDRLPASGDFEIRISLERTIPVSDEPLRLQLPRPLSGNRDKNGDAETGPDSIGDRQLQSVSVTPATLVVYAEESLDFAPLLPSMPDFSQSTADPLPMLPDDMRELLATERLLHFQAAATDKAWQFVCLVRQRPQSITARSRLDLKIEGTRIDATQTLELMVAHQPLQNIELEAPKSMAGATLWYDDQPLSTRILPKLPNAERMNIFATLPVPQSGPVVLKLTYPVTMPQNNKDAPWKLSIPSAVLVTEPPVADVETVVAITDDHSNRQFGITGAQWQPVSVEDQGQSGNLVMLSAKGSFSTIPLEVSPMSALEGPTVIRAAWYQTVYTGDARVDRAVFRFTTPRTRLEFELPLVDGRTPTEVLVGIDGQRAQNVRAATDRVIAVDVPRRKTDGERVVELWYTIPGASAHPSGPIRLAVLRESSDVYVSYWKLVLPRNIHLIADPSDLTPEYRWEWSGPFWHRRPNKSQRELEWLLGAARAEPVAAATNQYLFSSFGAPSAFRVWTLSRSMLVLLISGTVLLVGLALLHLRVARHPAVLLLLAVVAIGLAIVRPGYGVMLAQAGMAGLVLIIGSRLMERLFMRRRDTVHLSRPSTYIPAGRLDQRGDSLALGTTATTPMAVELSSGEVDL